MDKLSTSFNPSKRTQKDHNQNLRMPKDFKIINGNRVISCHSFIFFQSKIEVIESLINRGAKDFHLPEEVDHSVLEKYVLYLYNDELLDIGLNSIMTLFKISDIFQDDFLKQQIEYFTNMNLSHNTIPMLIFDFLRVNRHGKNSSFMRVLDGIINYTKKKKSCNNQMLAEKLLGRLLTVLDEDFSFGLSQLEELLKIIEMFYGFDDGFKLLAIDIFFSKRAEEINFNDIRSSGCFITTDSKETVQNFIDKYVNVSEIDQEVYDKYYRKYANNNEREETELNLKRCLHEISEKNKKLKEIEELNNSYLRAKKDQILSHNSHSQSPVKFKTYSSKETTSVFSAYKGEDDLKSILMSKNLEIKSLIDDFERLNQRVSSILDHDLSPEKDKKLSHSQKVPINHYNMSNMSKYENKRYSVTLSSYDKLLSSTNSVEASKPKKEKTKHVGKYFEYALYLNQKLEGHKGHVNCLLYNPINKTIVSGGEDHTVKVWDSSSAKCLQTMVGHNGYVYHLEQIKEYNNSFDSIVASASWDNTIKIWNLDVKCCLATLLGHRSAVRCSLYLKDFDRNCFASGDNDGELIIWHIGKGEKFHSFGKAHEGTIYSLLSLKDLHRSFIVSSGEDTRIRLWDVENRVCVETLIGHNNEVRCLVYLDAWEKCLLASGGDDNVIKVWNIESEECEITLKGHESYVRCLIYLKNVDEVTLISGGWDNMIRLWKVNRAQCIKTFGGISFIKTMIYLDEYEKITFVTGDDETIKIWEINAFKAMDLSKYL